MTGNRRVDSAVPRQHGWADPCDDIASPTKEARQRDIGGRSNQ
jgi:hypothetical protein